MEEVPCHDPRVGRASGTPDCFTLVLDAIRRKTPLFRHWRKCRQPSLAKGWRKRYRELRPVERRVRGWENDDPGPAINRW